MIVGNHSASEPGPARDVNADGLGDRRGLAIEKVPGPRTYRPGTLEVLYQAPSDYLIYVDGIRRARRPTFAAATALGTHMMRR